MAVTLHVVGCGRVGRSLARLWADAGTFDIGQVVNRSVQSARTAVDFIGQGRAVARLSPVEAGEWLMLAAPDSRLTSIAETLAARSGASLALAFHVSGAEPAEALRPLGCPVASVHPVCPFSDPIRAVETFSGSYALGEGDSRALDLLLPAFSAIGAQSMRFNPVDKHRYHAATVAASNFLNVLDDLALRLAESAGLDSAQALKVIVALQRTGLANIERAGPRASLTGPIERGDEALCRRIADIVAGDELYRALARATVDLAERKHRRQVRYQPDPIRALFGEPDVAQPEGTDGGV